MSNTDNPRGFEPAQYLYGGTNTIPLWEVSIKSNHIFAYKDAVYASAGYARNAVTTDKAVLGVVASKTYAHSAAGTVGLRTSNSASTRPKMYIWPALDGVVFTGQCSGTPTQANIWTAVDIEGAAANSTAISSQEVNEDATANKNVWLIGFKGNTSIGANAEVLFTWAKNKFSARGISATSTTLIGS